MKSKSNHTPHLSPPSVELLVLSPSRRVHRSYSRPAPPLLAAAARAAALRASVRGPSSGRPLPAGASRAAALHASVRRVELRSAPARRRRASRRSPRVSPPTTRHGPPCRHIHRCPQSPWAPLFSWITSALLWLEIRSNDLPSRLSSNCWLHVVSEQLLRYWEWW